jgi:hypothetical protein
MDEKEARRDRCLVTLESSLLTTEKYAVCGTADSVSHGHRLPGRDSVKISISQRTGSCSDDGTRRHRPIL